MKKLIYLFLTATLWSLSLQAAIRNEWTFQSDATGTLLTDSINTGTDGSSFESGGTGVLEADGFGALLVTPSETALWTGTVLDAPQSADSEPLYLRYDLEYNLTNENHTVGTSIGISFVDDTGDNVAGLVLAYDPNGSIPPPANRTLTPVAESLPLAGTISAIAKVDFSATSPTITVWYDTSGGSSFVESNPAKSNVGISISSISDLRIQATGEATPSGSEDFVAIENIRVADSWSEISVAADASFNAKYLNEWIFDRDPAGRTLSEAMNTGTDGAVFSTDASRVTQTDGLRGMIFNNNVLGAGNFWTDGAVLTADVQDSSSATEIRYLRYDFKYDMTAPENDSGTLLALAFTDGVSSNLAGVALKYDVGTGAVPPAGITESNLVSDLELTGSMSVIAKVDLGQKTMEVWYDLSGNDTFSTEPNATIENIKLTAISELQFRATGDFIASSDGEAVTIDNIRTAATWADIATDLEDAKGDPELFVTMSDSKNGVMEVGETNTIYVAIHNTGGPATEVTSTLTHNGGSGLTIISSDNTPRSLAGSSVLTNSYLVVANQKGADYVFTAQAFSTRTNSPAATLPLTVGAEITLDSYQMTGETGFMDGFAEPAETFNLVITSTNSGSRSVANVTNTLVAANSSYFSITPITSTIYPNLEVKGSASTTYEITVSATAPHGPQTFSVINSSSVGTWSETFELDIFSQGIPELSTNALTIQVPSGESASGEIVLKNNGNNQMSFSVTSDGNLPVSSYNVETQTEYLVWFDANPQTSVPGTFVTNWNGTSSEAMEFGFDFPFYGEVYTNFTINRYGALTLGNSTDGANLTGTLPQGDHPVIAPFWGESLLETNSVRYKKENDRLIVSWGNQTDNERQAWLYNDGRIRFLYSRGTWGSAAIGLQNELYSKSLNYTPGLTSYQSLLLTPSSWIGYIPSQGTIDAMGSRTLTITADASDQPEGTSEFTALVNWDTGETSEIAVTVIVGSITRQLSLPSSFTFSGPAGSISAPAYMSVTNSGNARLNYRITDLGQQVAGYTQSEVNYQWDYIPAAGSFLIELNNRISDKKAIGFPFSFYGKTYTNLQVTADGTIVFDDQHSISVFEDDHTVLPETQVLSMADTGFDRFVVTWNDISQPGGGNSQTFQAVLNRDGSIQCNYQQLTGAWTNGEIGLTGQSGAITGTLSNESTYVFTTNTTTETVIVTNYFEGTDIIIGTTETEVTHTNITAGYTDTANRQSILFTPGQKQVISASPISGTVPANSSAIITLIGDARSLSSGGSADVASSTTLSFDYEAGSAAVDVTFIATNSVENAYPAGDSVVKSSMWGTDNPTVTSTQNADGSRTLSWPAPNDSLSRAYTIWYTTSLSEAWTEIITVRNVYTYLDDSPERNTEPVIFYKVTVE